MANPNIKGTILSKGVGTTSKHKPIAVRYSVQTEEILRSLPDRSDFIRKAVEEALKAEGLIDGGEKS